MNRSFNIIIFFLIILIQVGVCINDDMKMRTEKLSYIQIGNKPFSIGKC